MDGHDHDEFSEITLRPFDLSDVDDFMEAIGSISVTPGSGIGEKRGELGYALTSKYWGKGIVTRAVKIVVGTIFREWPNLERLEALVAAENLGSQRVLEKAGFHKEGVLRKWAFLKGRSRDTLIFSLLSSDSPLD
ncbi:acyl-CoA N-acyltransferases (NAT) superfamily protein [Actinidia rufa]|uniref:Acyl-CoA N-acyltransferases (NAT) superfamily protein n=1 Tax=Actinidia rufa TaxID=165716 RepID=A0A7J0EFC6_9ERIC|nr:acyl-CoA N-acyltransferases (NAT) superfamily protein [Actinidia rufa]